MKYIKNLNRKEYIMDMYERFLGDDEVGEQYGKEDIALDDNWIVTTMNNYTNGNIKDFKEAFTSPKDVADFVVYLIEQEQPMTDIAKMLTVLTR